MNFKIISVLDVEKDGKDATNCFFNEFVGTIQERFASFDDVRSFSYRVDVIANHGEWMAVRVFDCEVYCVEIPTAKKFPSLSMPGCSWRLAWCPMSIEDDVPWIVTICSNQKYLYDGECYDDDTGITKMPLEYFFAKDYLAEIHLKRDLNPELGIEINEKYDLNNYKTIKDAFKEACEELSAKER